MKPIILVAAAALMLAACATTPRPRDTIARVNPASVAASPAEWDGRQVEMVGLLVWEFENLGLYQDYGTFCREGERTAIYVNWHNWPGVKRADSRRRVVVRGVFHNGPGVIQPNGAIPVTNAAPGPGPLDPGQVIRWLSPPAKPCPKALP
jgi:starvation-inducible outer membrane lipoprotein